MDSSLFLSSRKKFLSPSVCHLKNRKTANFFTNSPEQILMSEPLSKISVVQSLDQVPLFCIFRSKQSLSYVLSPDFCSVLSHAISVPMTLCGEIIVGGWVGGWVGGSYSRWVGGSVGGQSILLFVWEGGGRGGQVCLCVGIVYVERG